MASPEGHPGANKPWLLVGLVPLVLRAVHPASAEHVEGSVMLSRLCIYSSRNLAKPALVPDDNISLAPCHGVISHWGAVTFTRRNRGINTGTLTN
ncbi:hypothetical protein B0J13DRAFT_159000 [Dactylonectria estremocensis]|uniref:Uncharacterized protein n=1 Tax=Dactylonectria estremocensis TaxID=1079267 RepID=A0A9P9DLR1_9HYPO|nr:hypothetical protein B0J13DRAFT_159000 [Dactylonectria estremocensis]